MKPDAILRILNYGVTSKFSPLGGYPYHYAESTLLESGYNNLCFIEIAYIVRADSIGAKSYATDCDQRLAIVVEKGWIVYSFEHIVFFAQLIQISKKNA